MELQPVRARRFLHVSHDALGIRTVRVHQQGDTRARGTSSDSSSKRLVVSSSVAAVATP
jgi:hypothetical protein